MFGRGEPHREEVNDARSTELEDGPKQGQGSEADPPTALPGGAGGPTLLSGTLTGNLAAVGGGHGTSPPQSSAFGKTLSGWMQTWIQAGPGQQVGNVLLLPLPVGTPSGGTGTFGDPQILQGHTDVTLKPGTAIVLPVVAWVGERYDFAAGGSGHPADPKLPQEYLTANPISVTLDGRTLIGSNQRNVSQYYFDVPLDINYASPSSYGSTGAIFAQGVGLVLPPLAVGEHTLTVDSFLKIPKNDPNGPAYLNPDEYTTATTPTSSAYGIGFHYENSWTINVAPGG